MNFEIPTGLMDLLQDFTVAVLRDKPSDLVQFAAEYFNKLNDGKASTKAADKKGVSFGGGGGGSDEEPMDSDEHDDPHPEHMKNRFERRKSVVAERYNPSDDEDDGEKIVYPKSDDQRQRLVEAVKHILLFRSLDAEQMQEVIDAMFEKKVQPGEHVIDQGDDGDNFYVIDSGTYDIYVKNNGADRHVGSYDQVGSFGELALLYNQPRAATIVATSDGTLWAMDRSTFKRIVLKNAYNRRKMYESLIDNVPMLKYLDPYERMNIADALTSKKFEDGELIIKQGDSADCMYFIEDGEVRITIRQKDSEEEVEVTRCKKGDYFGELALVTHKPRAASAYAVGTTKCAVLDVGAFERLLGPCMDIMKRNIEGYEEQLVQIFGSKAEIGELR